jgi:insulysin
MLVQLNSKNQKNLRSDAWRLDQLENSTSNASHLYSKFGTGNLQTFKKEPESKGLSVREELL